MRFLLLGLAVVSVSFVAACGRNQAAGGATASAGPVVAAAGLPVLGPAPEFKLTTLEGKEITAAGLKGKVVVVDFWATWCPPCVAEIPGYVELQKKYGGQGLVIIGVSLDRGGAKVVQPFATKRGINYPLVLGDDALVEQFGGVEAIPTTFLIDREGRVRHKKVGGMDHEEYEALVKQVL